jgi:hypothetical protein
MGGTVLNRSTRRLRRLRVWPSKCPAAHTSSTHTPLNNSNCTPISKGSHRPSPSYQPARRTKTTSHSTAASPTDRATPSLSAPCPARWLVVQWPLLAWRSGLSWRSCRLTQDLPQTDHPEAQTPTICRRRQLSSNTVITLRITRACREAEVLCFLEIFYTPTVTTNLFFL